MATSETKQIPKLSTNTPPSHNAIGGSQVLDAVPDMLFRIGADGRLIGYKPAEGLEPYVAPADFIGRHLKDVLPQVVAGAAMTCIGQALATKKPQSFTYQLEVEGTTNRYEARIVRLSDEEVLAIVRDVTPDARPVDNYALTLTELAILSCVALGLTDKQIASNRHISPVTVRKHVASIRRKMGASSRTEAAVRAVREGILGG